MGSEAGKLQLVRVGPSSCVCRSRQAPLLTQILAADWPAPLASADIDELASLLFPVSICLFYIPFNTGVLNLETGWTSRVCAHLGLHGFGGSVVRNDEEPSGVQQGPCRVHLIMVTTVVPCEPLADPESGAWLSDRMP